MNNIFLKIKIHPLFWLTIFIGIITASFKEIMLLFSIVFIHELGHACMANYYGWRIKKIELLPFGGVAEVEEYGNKSMKEEIMVLLAGPFQHVWIFLLCKYLFVLGLLSEELYTFLFYNNLSILCFNLLPIWPLDGGKLIFVLISLRKPFIEAHKKIIIISLIFVSIFMIATILANPMNISLWMMILFLNVSIWKEWKQRRFIFIRFLVSRLSNKEMLKVKKVFVSKSAEIYDVFTLFHRGYKHKIIMEELSFEEDKLLTAYFYEGKFLMSELKS